MWRTISLVSLKIYACNIELNIPFPGIILMNNLQVVCNSERIGKNLKISSIENSSKYYSTLILWNIICACLASQSCLIFCDTLDCSMPGSSVLGIFQARILKWVIIFSFRGSSWSQDQTHVSWASCIAGRFFTH